MKANLLMHIILFIFISLSIIFLSISYVVADTNDVGDSSVADNQLDTTYENQSGSEENNNAQAPEQIIEDHNNAEHNDDENQSAQNEQGNYNETNDDTESSEINRSRVRTTSEIINNEDGTQFIIITNFLYDDTGYYKSRYLKNNNSTSLVSLEIFHHGLKYTVENGIIEFDGTGNQEILSIVEQKEQQLNMLSDSLIPVIIGNKLHYFYYRVRGNSDVTMFGVHANERIAMMGAREFVMTHGGRLYFFIGEGLEAEDRERMINIQYQGKTYYFDPNRIFSDEGMKDNFIAIRNMLRKADDNTADNWEKHSTYFKLILKDYKSIIMALGLTAPGPIISVHDNRNYSMAWSRRILTGRSSGYSSSEYVCAQPNHTETLYLCTHQQDFNALRNSGYNVILQDLWAESDDGSCSIAFELAGKRYILVEVSAIESTFENQQAIVTDMIRRIAQSAY